MTFPEQAEAGDPTDLHTWLAGQPDGVSLELLAELSSLGHDTFLAIIGRLGGVRTSGVEFRELQQEKFARSFAHIYRACSGAGRGIGADSRHLFACRCTRALDADWVKPPWAPAHTEILRSRGMPLERRDRNSGESRVAIELCDGKAIVSHRLKR